MRTIRILLVGLALLIGSWVAVSEGGRRLIARRLSAITGLEVAVADVDVLSFPPGFAVEGVSVRHPGRNAVVLEIARVRVPAAQWLRFRTGAAYRIIRPRLFALATADAPLDRARAAAAIAVLLRDAPVLVRGAEIALDEQPVGASAVGDDEARNGDVRDIEADSADGGVNGHAAFGSRMLRLPVFTVDRARVRADADGRGGDFAATVATGGGRLALRARWRATPSLRARVAVTINALRLGAVAGTIGASGAAGGRANGRIRWRRRVENGAPASRIDGNLALAEARWRRADERLVVAARQARIEGFRVDPEARAIRIEWLAAAGIEVDVPAIGEEKEIEGRSAAVAAPQRDAAAWSVSIARASLGNGRITVGAIPNLPAIELRAFYGRDLSTTTGEGAYLLGARVASGGHIRLQGRFDGGAGRTDANVKLADVGLAAALRPFASRVQVTKGRFDARVDVEGPPWVVARGRVAVDDLAVSTVGEVDDEPFLVWDDAVLALDGLSIAPLHIRPRRLLVNSARLRVRRDAAGIFPLGLLASDSESAPVRAARRAALALLGAGTGGEVATAGAAPPPAGPMAITVTGGGVRVEDRTVEPAFLATFEEIDMTIMRTGTEEALVTNLRSRFDDGGTLRGALSADRDGVAGSVSVDGLALPMLNPYGAPACGWIATGGRARVAARLDPGAHPTIAVALVIDGLMVKRAAGPDLLGDLVGLPPTEAIGLAADADGRLAVDFLLTADPSAPGYGLSAAVPAAVRTGVQNAIVDQLFADADFIGGPDVETIGLAPLAFPLGQSVLTPATTRAIDRIAIALRRFPGLSAFIRGRRGEGDAEALRDLAVVEWLRNEQSDDAVAIRAALEAHLGITRSRAGPLSDAERERLAALRAVALPSADAEDALARARAEAVVAHLIGRHGVARTSLRIASKPGPGPGAVTVELRVPATESTPANTRPEAMSP